MAAPAWAYRPPARSTRHICSRLLACVLLAWKEGRMQTQPRAARQCLQALTHAVLSY